MPPWLVAILVVAYLAGAIGVAGPRSARAGPARSARAMAGWWPNTTCLTSRPSDSGRF